MSTHVLKVAPPYFDALRDGSKTFEVRKNDRAYQAGDELVLYDIGEWSPHNCPPDCGDSRCTRKGRTVTRRVSFVYSGDPRFGGHGGLQPGYVVLGLAAAASPTPTETPE